MAICGKIKPPLKRTVEDRKVQWAIQIQILVGFYDTFCVG